MWRKTATFFEIAAVGGWLAAGGAAGHEAALRDVGRHVGTAFQISDDVIDIESDPEMSGKVPGTDLREGVHTLPVLYALRETGPDADRLRGLLAAPLGGDDRAVAEALALLRDSNGIAAAKAKVRYYGDLAGAELAGLPGGPGRDALAALVDYTVNRHG